MKIAIFSDLHLSLSRRPEHEKIFIDTLQSLRKSDINELWLLGDIYDLMVGPFKFWKSLHNNFFQELEAWVSEGRSVVWVQGNHDFFLEDLIKPMGIICSDSFLERTVDGKKIFLAHGDLVNLKDTDYLRWRAFTRSHLFQKFLKVIPENQRSQWIPKLGNKLSHKSRAQDPQRGRKILDDVFKDFARSKWHEGFYGVCLGHSHIEAQHTENSNFYLNLGSWINYSPRYALWETESYNYPQMKSLGDSTHVII